jgi:hypothetical protein
LKSGLQGIGIRGGKAENFEKESGARRPRQSQNPHASKTKACGTRTLLNCQGLPPTYFPFTKLEIQSYDGQNDPKLYANNPKGAMGMGD